MGLDALALMIVAAVGPTTVAASNLLYIGTLAALYGSCGPSAGMIKRGYR